MRSLTIALLLSFGLVSKASESGLLDIQRVYVDPLVGGDSAAQMRDLLIAALERSKAFRITENPDKADTFLRGAASDNTFEDVFNSSDSINAHVNGGSNSNSQGVSSPGGGGTRSSSSRKLPGDISIGQNESTNIRERKHEAMATVRLVNKDGDVVWSTTKESLGAKFRGASADVADHIVKQLLTDLELARNPRPVPSASK